MNTLIDIKSLMKRPVYEKVTICSKFGVGEYVKTKRSEGRIIKIVLDTSKSGYFGFKYLVEYGDLVRQWYTEDMLGVK